MLIMPVDHAASLRRARRLSTREKWLIRSVLGAMAVLAAGVLIALSTSGPGSGRGCLHLTIPAATGAGEINECGSVARHTCATARRPGAFTAVARDAVLADCRKAGLPVG